MRRVQQFLFFFIVSVLVNLSIPQVYSHLIYLETFFYKKDNLILLLKLIWSKNNFYSFIPRYSVIIQKKFLHQSLILFIMINFLIYSFNRKSVPDDISTKRRRLVFKTGVIMYIKNIYKNYSKKFLEYIFTYIYLCYKIKT